jgi:hypothetical protein
MVATIRAMETTDRCDLCGARIEGTGRERFAHLRAKHPAYARGLVMRLLSPGVFLIWVLLLGALHAPQWAYLVALGVSFGLLFFGKVRSRVERSRAGARPTLPMRRLLQEGGLAIFLIVPTVVLLILFLSRK